MNSADFTGQRPWPEGLFSFLACVVRPTAPWYRRKAMQRLCAITSSRYFLALFRDILRRAKAVSRVFLK